MNIYLILSKFENIYKIFNKNLLNISWSNVFGKFVLIVKGVDKQQIGHLKNGLVSGRLHVHQLNH